MKPFKRMSAFMQNIGIYFWHSLLAVPRARSRLLHGGR